jgi:hypothetical protein
LPNTKLEEYGITRASPMFQKITQIRAEIDDYLVAEAQSLRRGKNILPARPQDIYRWADCSPRSDLVQQCLQDESSSALNEAALCSNVDQGMKELLKARVESRCMRFACENPSAGFLKGGLCWWHSQFQQRAWQLAVFRPEEALLRPREMERRLAQLFRAESVVEFPGVANWAELSFIYKDLLLQVMLREQAKDALKPEVWSEWAKGSVSAEQTFEYGRQIEAQLQRGNSQFVYLKYSVFAQHAYVAFKAERQGNALKVYLLDSNAPEQRDENWVIFLEDENERQATPLFVGTWKSWRPADKGLHLENLKSAWQKHCENKPPVL